MKLVTIIFLFLYVFVSSVSIAVAQKLTVQSPNQKISVAVFNQQNTNSGEWYLKVAFTDSGKTTEAIPKISLGLLLQNQDFSKELLYLKATKPAVINERYTALHGKKVECSNTGSEVVVSFENKAKSKLNVVIRAYNDGFAFRYELPDTKDSLVVKDELTAYTIPRETVRWMERWNPANEGLYTAMNNEKVQQQEWCYPALFNTSNKACWFLLHESDVNGTYCGTKLSNTTDSAIYKLTFPNPRDGRG